MKNKPNTPAGQALKPCRHKCREEWDSGTWCIDCETYVTQNGVLPDSPWITEEEYRALGSRHTADIASSEEIPGLQEAIKCAEECEAEERWLIESLEKKAFELGGVTIKKYREKLGTFENHCKVLQAARAYAAITRPATAQGEKKINATVDGRSFENMGEFIAYSHGRNAGWNAHLKKVGKTPIVLVPENASLIHRLILAAEQQDSIIEHGEYSEGYAHERFRLEAYSLHLEAKQTPLAEQPDIGAMLSALKNIREICEAQYKALSKQGITSGHRVMEINQIWDVADQILGEHEKEIK